MRLFDKVASQGPEQVRNAIRTLNDSFAVLRVDSIANDYATSQKLWWSPEDYPYFRLPWDRCFIEWNEPKVIVWPRPLPPNARSTTMYVMLPPARLIVLFTKVGMVAASARTSNVPPAAYCTLAMVFRPSAPPSDTRKKPAEIFTEERKLLFAFCSQSEVARFVWDLIRRSIAFSKLLIKPETIRLPFPVITELLVNPRLKGPVMVVLP